MPTKRRRFMVNVPTALEPAVIKRAQQANRSVANYIECLILDDIKAAGILAESPGAYGEPNPDEKIRISSPVEEIVRRPPQPNLPRNTMAPATARDAARKDSKKSDVARRKGGNP